MTTYKALSYATLVSIPNVSSAISSTHIYYGFKKQVLKELTSAQYRPFEKPAANITINRKKLKAFPLR